MNKELLLSNVMIEAVVKLNDKLKDVQVNNGFGIWEQYFIAPESYNLNDYSCIILILDGDALINNYSDVKDFANILSYIEAFSKVHYDIKLYISNIKCRTNTCIDIQKASEIEKFECNINAMIYELCKGNSNIVCFNLKGLINQKGEDAAFSKKMEYMSSCPYSMQMLKIISEEIAHLNYFANLTRKKCLVLDLDNTLWGGILGEDGVENLTLSSYKEGKQFSDFQKMILNIKSTGVILAISSKNNEEDVELAFEKPEMILKKTDFVSFKINWNPKSQSIKEIAKELNIGLDSIVFIDDNPVERAEISEQIPEVIVPDFPKDNSQLENFAYEIYRNYFYIDKVLFEDTNKTEMYHANIARDEVKKKAVDLDTFIKTLGIELIIEKGTKDHIQRLAQMTQKTNQFNMTTRRYTESQIAEFVSDDNTLIFAGRVKDKFGDNGISIALIAKIEDERAVIDTFLMSCRVMERKIEYDFMRFVENWLFEKNYKVINAEFIATKKNIPAADFYYKYGFDKTLVKEDVILFEKEICYQEYSNLVDVKEG